MKNRFCLLLGAFLLLSSWAMAQSQGQGKNGLQRLKTAKIALITNRLNLSADQSQQFWAIYNEYEGKKQGVRRSIRKINAETNNLTTADERILSDLNEMMSLRQKEVDLDKEYMARFLKIINPRQLAELYKAEQQFTRMLLEKLNNQRQPKEGQDVKGD